MSKLRTIHPRHSTVVAYLALFIALGGTGYAAVRTPSHSAARGRTVRRQPLKVTATVRFWASVSGAPGRVVASRPRARLQGGRFGETGVSWGRAIPAGCFPVVTLTEIPGATTSTVQLDLRSKQAIVNTTNFQGNRVQSNFAVAVFC